MKKNEIVIARYNENLDWVAGIQSDFEVIIYNKGPALSGVSLKDDQTPTLAFEGQGPA